MIGSGFLGKMLLGTGAGGIAEGAKDLTSAAEGIKTLFTGKLSPGKEREYERAVLEFTGRINEAQAKINAAEAEHPSFFVAGWRPACGWLGVFGFFYATIGYSIMSWVCLLLELPSPPQIDTSILTTILFGILGIGGMRSYDKKNNTHNRH